jgi:predicted ATPase
MAQSSNNYDINNMDNDALDSFYDDHDYGRVILNNNLVELSYQDNISCNKADNYPVIDIGINFDIRLNDNKQVYVELSFGEFIGYIGKMHHADFSGISKANIAIDSLNIEFIENTLKINCKMLPEFEYKSDDGEIILYSLNDLATNKSRLDNFLDNGKMMLANEIKNYFGLPHLNFRSDNFLPVNIIIPDIYTLEEINNFVKLLLEIPMIELINEEDAIIYMKKEYLELLKISYIDDNVYDKLLRLISYELGYIKRTPCKNINNSNIFSYIFKNYFPNLPYIDDFSKWYYVLSKIKNNEKAEIKNILNNEGEKIIQEYTNNRNCIFSNVSIRKKLINICSEITDYFSTKIKYLGPLREDPMWEYPKTSELNSDIDVKGKNIVSVLKNNEDQNYCVENYISPMDITLPCYNLGRNKNIKDALNEWLIHLGISNGYNIITLPIDSTFDNFGIDDDDGSNPSEYYELKLLNGEKYYTPAQVGTGISQVFPILVTCLLSSPGSTIIIEQPELHLHPKMQSKLTDFFIAMALSGRQCLIETHSEYMIEQIRYRVLCLSKQKDDKLKLHNKMKLYFVSQRDGVSYFNDIKVNDNAALSEWPDDFFDESHKIARKIADEALKTEEEEQDD